MARVGSERMYTGRIINLDVDFVRFPDGSTGGLEMIRHPGAAAVVPFLDTPGTRDPRALLIRQFRHAANGFVWEIPAGRLDPGESPEECARRELREEEGVSADTLRHLTSIYTTPGFTDEVMEVHEVPWSEVGRLLRTGEIRDSKSMCALMFVQCFMNKP